MPVSHAIILGITQGLTEALPISSSAHLVLIPWLFKWRYQGVSFDVALHLGTAAAFGLYFFRDWVDILKKAFAKNIPGENNIFRCLVVGTIPAVFAGLILEKKAETAFRAPLAMAAMLAVFAALLWWADHAGKKAGGMKDLNFKKSVTIGFAQALAIIPGVSRSGITITAGLFEGFSREASAKFSFLLATPIVMAACALKLPKLHPADMNAAFWAGVIASAVSGFIAIHFLLRFVRRANLNIFVFYRLILAAAIAAIWIRH